MRPGPECGPGCGPWSGPWAGRKGRGQGLGTGLGKRPGKGPGQGLGTGLGKDLNDDVLDLRSARLDKAHVVVRAAGHVSKPLRSSFATMGPYTCFLTTQFSEHGLHTV